MPRLARFWDSLENENLFDGGARSSSSNLSKNSKINNSSNKLHQQWLSSLALSRDDELSTILYAKSLLNKNDRISNYHNNEYFGGAKKVSVGYSKSMLSTSLGDLVPIKPQRRIAKLRSSTNDITNILNNQYSNDKVFGDFNGSNTTLCSTSNFDKCNSLQDNINFQNIHFPGFRGNVSTSVQNRNSSTPTRAPPPTYEQFQIKRRNSTKKNVSSINNSSPLKIIAKVDVSTDSSTNTNNTILRSPFNASNRSDSITSVDSGQCSGDQIEKRSICSSLLRQESKDDDDGNLPTYARMASTMDHVLRTSSALYTLLSATLNTSLSRDLLAKTSVFIQLVESSPCASNLPKNELSQLKTSLQELQKNRENGIIDLNNLTNFFAILLRKTIESILQVFVKIICKYLNEASIKDRLLSISLEHLIHICLFGDELCIEAIQKNSLNSILRLLKTNSDSTSENTFRFLLRTIAVLCGVSKGALTLLTQGGLELVIDNLLSNSSCMCSVEAAGILTQLTNPQNSFIRLNHIHPIISRLLDLIDQCYTGDSLLLVSAALNNVAQQHPDGIDIMYRNGSIPRFINAYNRENCATVFVQEQIVTAFSRFASRHYEKELVEQNAIPVLLEFLSLTHPIHLDYCRRIRYKAAVCIGTLANCSIGLKSLYENNAYAILSNVLCDDNNVSNPFNMICNNIRNRLESKYQSESAV